MQILKFESSRFYFRKVEEVVDQIVEHVARKTELLSQLVSVNLAIFEELFTDKVEQIIEKLPKNFRDTCLKSDSTLIREAHEVALNPPLNFENSH